jgi:hypothetical protein
MSSTFFDGHKLVQRGTDVRTEGEQAVTPEGAILDAILGYLQAERVTAWRMNTGAVKLENRFIQFNVAGFSDILAIPIVRGKFKGFPVQWCEPWFIEVKTEKGRQSAEQKSFELQVKDAGAQYFVIRSVEEMGEILRKHGVKK